MTDAEQRELNRYQQYYNANKLAYMMAENQKLPENFDNKLLRYDANTRQVERLNITKKIDSDEVGTIVYLDDRRKRLLKDIKEKDIDYLTNTEI